MLIKHFSVSSTWTLVWKIPWTEVPDRLQSMGLLSQTRLSDFTFIFHFHALEKDMETHSNVLAWRIPGTGEPGGLPSMGSHRVGHDWSDLGAAVAAVCLFFWILVDDRNFISLPYLIDYNMHIFDISVFEIRMYQYQWPVTTTSSH